MWDKQRPEGEPKFPSGRPPGRRKFVFVFFLAGTESHRAFSVLDLAELVAVAVNQYRHRSGSSRRLE
jgi:hypothetical protein